MRSIKEVLGQKATNMSDQTIANNALAVKSAAANAYLIATLKAATPELKQLFSANLTQVVGEHTALSQLAANKGWVTPYEQPQKQLYQTLNESQEILDSHISI
ncbi:MAG: spore coat protein [Clostridiales bacterium]|jgi:spore coat protein CotF|nr:spore coat protein [Clostridiales bacterium]